MALLLSCINKRRYGIGFTLLEVLLVLSIFAMVLYATLFATTTMYQAELLRTERSTILQLLQTARNYAQVHFKGSSSGVAFNPDGYRGYVLFIGTSFAESALGTRVYQPSGGTIVVASSTPSEVVFQAVSGNTKDEVVITLLDSNVSGRIATIVINHSGYVGW